MNSNQIGSDFETSFTLFLEIDFMSFPNET